MNRTEAVQALNRLSQGLLFPSETDKPFDVVTFNAGEKSLNEEILSYLGLDKNQRVEEVTIDDQFEGLFEGADGARFKEIRTFFTENLTSSTVLRVGQIEIDIFILGKSLENQFVGLHTKSVET